MSAQMMQMLQQAVGLHQSGKLAEAGQLYDAVLKQNPKQADALHLKGVVHMSMGDYKAAEKLMQKALKQDKRNPAIWGNLGANYLGQKKYRQAIDTYNNALTLNPQYAEGLQGRGISQYKLGEIADAKVSLVQALAIKEALPQSYYHLGLLYKDEHDFDSAEQNFIKARSLAPADTDIILAHGVLLMQMERITEAVTVFESLYAAGLKTVPLYVNYARCLMLQGDMEKSKEMIHEGYEAHSANDRVLSLYTLLDKAPPESSVFKALEELYTQTEKNSDAHKRVCFGLARGLEHGKKFLESMPYWIEGNAVKRAGIEYDHARMKAFYESVKETFTPEFIESLKGAGRSDETPIFIVGMPRSGTTLTEQILSTHPEVFAAGERDHLQDVLQIKDRHGFNNKPLVEWGRPLTNESLKSWAESYLQKLKRDAGESPYHFISDKMPSNALFIGFIKLMLPHAKIIHCARSGMATCLSCFKQDFTYGQGYCYDLSELGDYYVWHEELMAHWKELFPEGIYTMQYEEMVNHQERETENLFNYLGLDVPEGADAFHRQDRDVMTASASQVRQPMYKGSLDKWKRYEDGLDVLHKKIAHLEPSLEE
ncbi:MAG: sulfotransferase [Alphaproteobacteria bacterium]|nr:sulfotransferase [Alphaproteobacteria bacterium]